MDMEDHNQIQLEKCGSKDSSFFPQWDLIFRFVFWLKRGALSVLQFGERTMN